MDSCKSFFIVLQKGEQLSDFLFHQCRMHFEMSIDGDGDDDGDDDDDDDSIHSFIHSYIHTYFTFQKLRSKEGILVLLFVDAVDCFFHSTTH